MPNPELAAFVRQPSFYEGTAAQRVANQDKVATGDIWTDTDTGDVRKKNFAGGWDPIRIAGAGLIHQTGSDVPFPESWSADFSFTGTVAALGTTSVITNYSKGTFVISGLTGETISVTGLIGAAMTLETAAIRVIDLNTGAVAAASVLGNGSYKLVDLAAHKLKFTKSAAVENATVTLTMKA